MDIPKFIESEIPGHFLGYLPKLFADGHALAATVIAENPILQVPSLQTGDIRGAAIDWLVSKHIAEACYPGIIFEFRWFHKPTGKYLRIQTPNANVTINHLAHPSLVPRRAEFRRQARQWNQPELFAHYEEERRSFTDKAHLSLIYGDQKLEFMFLGAMHAKRAVWLDSPIDLLARPHVASVPDDYEGVNPEIPLKLKPAAETKEEFIKHISDGSR